MATLEFLARRVTRGLIEDVLVAEQLTLQQNTIENMVNERIVEVSRSIAQGINTPVDWRERVLAAVAQETKDRIATANMGITSKLVGTKDG